MRDDSPKEHGVFLLKTKKTLYTVTRIEGKTIKLSIIFFRQSLFYLS